MEIERYSVFYLEVDRTHKRIVFRLDRRNIGLMPEERLKANLRQVMRRIVDYRQGGFEIDGEEFIKSLS